MRRRAWSWVGAGFLAAALTGCPSRLQHPAARPDAQTPVDVTDGGGDAPEASAPDRPNDGDVAADGCKRRRPLRRTRDAMLSDRRVDGRGGDRRRGAEQWLSGRGGLRDGPVYGLPNGPGRVR